MILLSFIVKRFLFISITITPKRRNHVGFILFYIQNITTINFKNSNDNLLYLKDYYINILIKITLNVVITSDIIIKKTHTKPNSNHVGFLTKLLGNKTIINNKILKFDK